MGKFTISLAQAQQELDAIMGLREIDDVAFARAHMCMRVLGCPCNDKGKFIAIDEQPGTEARDLWEQYEDARDWLAEMHADWRDMQDTDGD